MSALLVEVAGWIGAALILLAYYLIASRRLDGRSRLYHAMNMLGGFSIGINSLLNGAYPAAALNVIWGSIAIYGFLAALQKGGKVN